MSLEPALNRHKHGEVKMTSPHLHKDHPRTTKSETIKLITNLIELPGPVWDKLFSYSFWRQIKTPKASRTVCPFSPPLPGMRLLYTVYDTHTHTHTLPPPWPRRAHSETLPPGSDRWVIPGEKGCPLALRVWQGLRETRLQLALRVKLKEKKTPDSPTVADGAKRWGISVESWGAQRRLNFPSCPSREPGMPPRSTHHPHTRHTHGVSLIRAHEL